MVYIHNYGIVKQKLTLAGLLIIAGLFAFLATLGVFNNANAASSVVIYDTIQSPLPSNLSSLGFEATSTRELGDVVQFAGTERNLSKVTIAMSSWACESGGWNTSDCVTTPGAKFSHPITLNLYEKTSTNAVGALIYTKTQTFDILYRPSTDPNCSGGAWKDSNSECKNGLAQNITFVLPDISVPDSLIFGVAYNTRSHGYVPLNVSGPYDSLNVGFNTEITAPYIGTDPDSDVLYWNTSYAPFYSDGGAGGVGIFRTDTGWDGYTVAARFETSESPAAPSVANKILKNSNVDAKYGKNKNYVSDVAKEMGNGTDFQGVAKTDRLAYECKIVDFLVSKGANVSSLSGCYKEIQSLTLNSNNYDGVNTTEPLLQGYYKFEVSGEWTNRGFESVDADYTSPDDWTTVLTGPGEPGNWPEQLLDVQINNGFVDWGTYNTSHTYTKDVNISGVVNFRVFDGDVSATPATIIPGWYDDNVGDLTVKVFKKY